MTKLMLIMLLFSSVETLAAVNVILKRLPMQELMSKHVLKNFPARQLKPDTKLVASAEAFIAELLTMSCQSCFAEIFAEKNFQHYRLLAQTDKEEYLWKVKRYLRKTSYSTREAPDYDVSVALTYEAELAAMLLNKFVELDEFYHAIGHAHRHLKATLPVDSARREIFVAQIKQYEELYQGTRATIEQVLTDLRTLLDEHGRDYPQEVLANVDSFEAHLRELAQAKETGLQGITDTVWSKAYEQDSELWDEARLQVFSRDRLQSQPDLNDALSPSSDTRPTVGDSFSLESNNSNYWRSQDDTTSLNNYYEDQRRQQEEIDRLNEMAAFIATDPLDIF